MQRFRPCGGPAWNGQKRGSMRLFSSVRAKVCYWSFVSTNTRSRMRKNISLLAAGLILLLPVDAHSQLSLLAGAAASGVGGAPQTPRFGGAMSKLFGDNKAFTAKIDM